MVFDYSKLKGLIIEKFDSVSAFSDAIGVAVQTVSAKLNNKLPVTKNDIIKWASVLGIEKEDIGIYFFTLKV